MSRPSTGKLADPAWRVERARKAATARTTLDAHIRAIADRAPELTDGQLHQLAGIASAQQPSAS
jgi:hypothetical protein